MKSFSTQSEFELFTSPDVDVLQNIPERHSIRPMEVRVFWNLLYIPSIHFSNGVS
jgi:hypothetical protein